MLKRFLSLTVVTAALAGAGAMFAMSSASAATAPEASSANWSGYVASGSSNFTRVSGSWVEPSANASAGDGYSAFWVGLGGSGQSNSLEQIGTQADVANGQVTYSAWYELVPAGQVGLNLAVHPGDHMSASVSVSGTSVTVSLSDQTTGQSFTKTLQMSNPDTSSAEWIAEAPSASAGQGGLQVLPLADFGTVNFTSANATSAGHTGPISDSSWTSEPVDLAASSSAGAQPSSLSSGGSAFAVSWQGAGSGGGSPSEVSSYGGGYGGGGYGYGGGGYGYGYGYGGGGYGYGGGYSGYSTPGYVYGY